MNKDEIMALADSYADEQRDWGNGSERTRIARAALEAALTEKQEPRLWQEGDDLTIAYLAGYGKSQERIKELEAALEEKVRVNGMGMEREAKLMARVEQLLSAMKWLDRWMGHKPLHECADKVRAAIAAAEGKV